MLNNLSVHKFTHTGKKVLLLRSGEIGHEGFQWPKSGKVICPKAQTNRELAATPDCESGGLFGWPWGIGIGDGKTPDFTQNWIVFAANPEDVIPVGHKAKVIGECEVIHCGPWYECFKIVEEGKLAWLKTQNNDEAISGYDFTAATSGFYSTAARSGFYSTAATSGHKSTAATSGNNSTAATSGYGSTAATSGDYSTAATSRDYSTAATSGVYSTAATSGPNSTAATSGNNSTAATSGDCSTATTSGIYSTAITNGKYSVASVVGNKCQALSKGKNSVAVAIGDCPTIEVAPGSVGVVLAEEFTWHAHPGAVVVQKWEDEHTVLVWDKPSKTVIINKGNIKEN